MIEIIIAIIGIAIMARFIPSFILLSRFAYPNAKFSAIPNTYIREKEVTRLLELKNLDDFKNNIVSRDFLIEGESVGEIQKSIDISLAKIIKMAKDDSPPKVKLFYDAYLQKLDGENIKEMVRSIYKGEEVKKYEMFSEESSILMNKLKKAEREEAEHILREYGFEVNFDMSIEEIEREIDKTLLKKLRKVPLPNSCKKVRDRFLNTIIDTINIKTILRGKHYGLKNIEKSIIEGGWEIGEWQIKELLKIDSIPEIISMLEGTSYMACLRQEINNYEKEGVIALERALDSNLIRIAGDISNENPMGLGPGIRFIVEKEFEARNLKAIAKAIGEGMQQEAKKVMVII